MLAFCVTPLIVTETVLPLAGYTGPTALTRPVSVTLDAPTTALWLDFTTIAGESLVTVNAVAWFVVPFSKALPA